MFDDFCPSASIHESRIRFRRSMMAATIIYGISSAAIVGATAAVHTIVVEKETQVAFAPPPEPLPPPPPAPAAPAAAPKAAPRPRVKRPELAAPDKISDEKLKESDKPLASASESGPADGFLDGAPGGTGTGTGTAAAASPPPPSAVPKVEPLVAPVDTGRNEKPWYSASAKRKGVEGTVVVAFDVLEDGSVSNPQIVSGPAELQESVLKAVRSWRFLPAHRGSENVRFHMKKSIVFRLDDG
jgi:periplasmic protein TonB